MYSALATPKATIARLQEAGLYTKKSLGQHFLVNDGAVGRILTLADLHQDDTILEVGPGIGTLTIALQDRVAHVIAIEYDEALIEALREVIDPAIVTIIHADAARLLREGADFAYPPIKLVANLPYQVAATVVLRAFETLPHLESATVMVQREVADRMRASIGTKDYSAYTLKLGLLAHPVDSFEVAPSNFLPPPRVDSTVIRLDRCEKVDSPQQYRQVKDVIDAAFAMRRKTLRNNLRARFCDETIEVACRTVGIEPAARAETLDAAQFTALSDALQTARD